MQCYWDIDITSAGRDLIIFRANLIQGSHDGERRGCLQQTSRVQYLGVCVWSSEWEVGTCEG